MLLESPGGAGVITSRGSARTPPTTLHRLRPCCPCFGTDGLDLSGADIQPLPRTLPSGRRPRAQEHFSPKSLLPEEGGSWKHPGRFPGAPRRSNSLPKRSPSRLLVAMAQKLSLLLLLLLFRLRDCSWARPDAPSIGCNFTITPNQSSWCEFEGQVNGNTFLWYNCTQKGKCECNILSMPRRARETCNREEEETPKLLTEEFKKMLFDTTGLHTLRIEMTCQREDNGRFYGSWYFYDNETRALRFDSKNGKRTRLNSNAGLINNTLNRHEDVIGYLLRKPSEICKSWYEKVWTHQDNALNTAAPVTSGPTTEPPTRASGPTTEPPTSASGPTTEPPTIASGPTTEPPTSASATDQSKNVNITLILGITFIVIVFMC
ncbi:UL16-binding protein 1-like [Rousettus aegyptiacus]|uniref:UL16-binding protein 1-like n=1 Tax=Rousettus aegyptiacus TaxID=9407 RepID=UPI00168D2B17|nr:UL16-binding protein 1-like [Rousettus aegyptiacus]